MGKTIACFASKFRFHFDIFLASLIAGMEYKIIKFHPTPSRPCSCLSFFHTFHCSPPGCSSGVEMQTNSMKHLMHLDCSLKTTALTNSNSRLPETCHSFKTYFCYYSVIGPWFSHTHRSYEFYMCKISAKGKCMQMWTSAGESGGTLMKFSKACKGKTKVTRPFDKCLKIACVVCWNILGAYFAGRESHKPCWLSPSCETYCHSCAYALGLIL